jgi:hypothetical protein
MPSLPQGDRMSGAANRAKGHRWEKDLARWFTAAGLGDVVSGRAVTGGTQQGSDLVTRNGNGHVAHDVNGWCIEAKDKTQLAVTGWLQQAADDANGQPHVVIHKRRQHPTGAAWCYLPACWAQPLLDIDLPPDVRIVTVDLTVFTAALTRWET